MDCVDGIAAQCIVTPELDDHDIGCMHLQGLWQSREPSACRLAADARVDDPNPVGPLLETLLQQRHPTRVALNPISGADTVAHHEKGPGSEIGRRPDQKQGQ